MKIVKAKVVVDNTKKSEHISSDCEDKVDYILFTSLNYVRISGRSEIMKIVGSFQHSNKMYKGSDIYFDVMPVVIPEGVSAANTIIEVPQSEVFNLINE